MKGQRVQRDERGFSAEESEPTKHLAPNRNVLADDI